MRYATTLATILIAVSALNATAAWAAENKGTALNTQEIERLTGAKGQANEKEGTFKVSAPRSDLKVSAAGIRMTPPLGLTSWAAFMPSGKQTMVMGDMVLTEGQVSPVMSVALDSGLEVTALHNHFLWESPRVMFMHIGGMGSEAQLAAAVGKVLRKISETSTQASDTPAATIDPAKTTLDPKKIEAVLGRTGDLKDGVYKVVVGRTSTMHGQTVGNTMGVNTWMAFAGSDDEAIVDGDFAMLESELQGVLKALRRAGINVVAIHNHMTQEEPRIMFLHYWGVGRTTDLAEALKTALAATAS
jgi:hypothetical protein